MSTPPRQSLKSKPPKRHLFITTGKMFPVTTVVDPSREQKAQAFAASSVHAALQIVALSAIRELAVSALVLAVMNAGVIAASVKNATRESVNLVYSGADWLALNVVLAVVFKTGQYRNEQCRQTDNMLTSNAVKRHVNEQCRQNTPVGIFIKLS